MHESVCSFDFTYFFSLAKIAFFRQNRTNPDPSPNPNPDPNPYPKPILNEILKKKHISKITPQFCLVHMVSRRLSRESRIKSTCIHSNHSLLEIDIYH